MVVKELKVEKKRSSSHLNVSAPQKGIKNHRNIIIIIIIIIGEVSYSQNFAFCRRVWELNPCKSEG
jgi:hypothetical protein